MTNNIFTITSQTVAFVTGLSPNHVPITNNSERVNISVNTNKKQISYFCNLQYLTTRQFILLCLPYSIANIHFKF